MPEIRQKIIKGQNWERMADYQYKSFFKDKGDGKPDDDLKSIMKLYGSDVFDQFDDDPKCANCGDTAAHRCSKCKTEWYCSRECQLARWKEHKKMCQLITKMKQEESKFSDEQKEKMKEQIQQKEAKKKKPLIEEVTTQSTNQQKTKKQNMKIQETVDSQKENVSSNKKKSSKFTEKKPEEKASPV